MASNELQPGANAQCPPWQMRAHRFELSTEEARVIRKRQEFYGRAKVLRKRQEFYGTATANKMRKS